ncbi:MAG: phenylacetate--CoA ligase family protein [Planctomycetales bacterium]|nr:phenylacetate--CoA ligase family protein [Planctomycetales bacterium]
MGLPSYVIRWCHPWMGRLAQELKQLEQRACWSRAEIDAYQLDQVNHLWKFARRRVRYYANLKSTSGGALPERFRSLNEFRAEMPLLRRETVRLRAGELVADEPLPGAWSQSGGSTGSPVRIWRDRQSAWQWRLNHFRQFQPFGVTPGDPMVWLWGHQQARGRGWKRQWARVYQPAADRFSNRLRLSAYHLDQQALRGYVRSIQKFRPAVLYGYTNAVYLLAREMKASGDTIDSLRVAVLTAEPIRDYQREAIQEAFGAKVIGEYGSMECGIVASEDVSGKMQVWEDSCLVETESTERGHEVIVTRFSNFTFPLLRYATEDIAEQPLVIPPSGYAELAPITGRLMDYLVARDGGLRHGTYVEHLMAHQPSVRRYQVRQAKDGSVRCLIELRDGQRPFDAESVQKQLTELLRGEQVAVEVTDHVPLTVAGKSRPVLSELTGFVSNPPD